MSRPCNLNDKIIMSHHAHTLPQKLKIIVLNPVHPSTCMDILPLKPCFNVDTLYFIIVFYCFCLSIRICDIELCSIYYLLHWFLQENYHKFDAFVILHGTDTMSFTASALSFMLENLGKPVILTGSQVTEQCPSDWRTSANLSSSLALR